MEFCTLEDAFPDFKTKSTARGEEKKKAKRCKGPALTYLTTQEVITDPDRPAQIKLPDVPPVNKDTGLREHSPVDAPQAEPFLDAGGEYEQLLSSLSANTTVGPTKLAKGKPPAFFGAGEDDDTTEGFASFTNVIGDDPGYKLTPDFTQTFTTKGAAKAGGLPTNDTNTNINWKPLMSGGSKTAFYSRVTDRPSSAGSAGAAPPYIYSASDDSRDILKRMDKIFARLDDLENRKSENAQTEVVLFVMSGIFILFTMDLLVRKAGSVRLVR
jgi:hypothetical protein